MDIFLPFLPNHNSSAHVQLLGFFTCALSKSMALISEPWKYLIRVCWRFSKPSNSRSGSALKFKVNQIFAWSSQWVCFMTIWQVKYRKIFLLFVKHPTIWNIDSNLWNFFEKYTSKVWQYLEFREYNYHFWNLPWQYK